MTEPEHLDPETTEPPQCPRCGGVHPEMYEPAAWDDDAEEWEPWDAEDWWFALSPADLARFGYRRQADLKTAPGYLDDGQRPADFDDEERRP